jgi:phosphatidylglycerophosphate synthase
MRALRAESIGTWLLAIAAVTGLAVLARARLSLDALYPVKAVFSVVAIACLSMLALERHHPFTTLGPANQVTTFRTVLVSLIVASVGERPTSDLAVAIAAVALLAMVLDGVDGWLARRTAMSSPFGARFDMEVDALLVLALAILVWQHDRAGAWVLLAGLWRYLFVAAGWVLPWMRRPLPPSSRRQVICVVQICGLVLAMLPIVPSWAQTAAAAITLLVLSGSFLVDMAWLYASDRREQVA